MRMALPTLHGTGRLVSDGELRYTNAGKAVFAVDLAFSSRKRDQNGEWVDGDKLFIRSAMFGDQAESVAESLQKGDEVAVLGRVRLDQWQDKQTGENRSRASLLVDSIGPTIRGGIRVTVQRVERSKPTSDSADEPPF